MRKLNLLEQKFGKLTVVGFRGTRAGKSIWDVVCDCGSKGTAVGSLLLRGRKISCGCASKKFFVDLTGQKFNKLTILEYIGKNTNKNHTYSVVCDCGKKIIAEGSDVKTGKIKSCGCQKTRHAIDYYEADPEASTIYNIWNDYRIKSKYRNLSFNINPFIFRLMLKSNCYYCGAAPSNVRKTARSDKFVVVNGIDRIDNNIGYEENNIVPCCTICNQAKHTLTKDTFLNWVNRIYNFQSGVK